MSKIPSLILPIKLYWLEKISCGEKKEEYREIKPFYQQRLNKFLNVPKFFVEFRAGYTKKAQSVTCMCKLKIGLGNENWGAEKDKVYYIFEILKIC